MPDTHTHTHTVLCTGDCSACADQVYAPSTIQLHYSSLQRTDLALLQPESYTVFIGLNDVPGWDWEKRLRPLLLMIAAQNEGVRLQMAIFVSSDAVTRCLRVDAPASLEDGLNAFVACVRQAIDVLLAWSKYLPADVLERRGPFHMRMLTQTAAQALQVSFWGSDLGWPYEWYYLVEVFAAYPAPSCTRATRDPAYQRTLHSVCNLFKVLNITSFQITGPNATLLIDVQCQNPEAFEALWSQSSDPHSALWPLPSALWRDHQMHCKDSVMEVAPCLAMPGSHVQFWVSCLGLTIVASGFLPASHTLCCGA